MTVGDRIKEARKRKRMSQEDLAQAIGTTKSAISRYEAGKRQTNLQQLRQIAQVLDADIAYLISGDSPDNVAPKSDIGARIREAREKASMTQVELGELVGVTGVAIMRYEKGQREPTLEQLQAIAKALHSNPSYLAFGESSKIGNQQSSVADAQPTKADIFREKIRLELCLIENEEDLDAIYRVVKICARESENR